MTETGVREPSSDVVRHERRPFEDDRAPRPEYPERRRV